MEYFLIEIYDLVYCRKAQRDFRSLATIPCQDISLIVGVAIVRMSLTVWRVIDPVTWVLHVQTSAPRQP